VQVNGAITASPATPSNQVVVKSQLDLKADLASPNLTEHQQHQQQQQNEYNTNCDNGFCIG
jgi:hypothetical protein